jgi:hypothetical protein
MAQEQQHAVIFDFSGATEARTIKDWRGHQLPIFTRELYRRNKALFKQGCLWDRATKEIHSRPGGIFSPLMALCRLGIKVRKSELRKVYDAGYFTEWDCNCYVIQEQGTHHQFLVVTWKRDSDEDARRFLERVPPPNSHVEWYPHLPPPVQRLEWKCHGFHLKQTHNRIAIWRLPRHNIPAAQQ